MKVHDDTLPLPKCLWVGEGRIWIEVGRYVPGDSSLLVDVFSRPQGGGHCECSKTPGFVCAILLSVSPGTAEDTCGIVPCECVNAPSFVYALSQGKRPRTVIITDAPTATRGFSTRPIWLILIMPIGRST